MGVNESDVSEDQIFDILSSARRRYVIYYLQNRNEEVTITELTEQVAAWEYDVAPDELTDQQQKRVYVSLYQTHLPKLTELGVVDYDQEEGVVSLTAKSRVLDSHLNRGDESEPRWRLVYLGLAVVGTLVLAVSIQDVGAFAAVDAATVGVVVAVAFGLVAVGQILYERYAENDPPGELLTRE